VNESNPSWRSVKNTTGVDLVNNGTNYGRQRRNDVTMPQDGESVRGYGYRPSWRWRGAVPFVARRQWGCRGCRASSAQSAAGGRGDFDRRVSGCVRWSNQGLSGSAARNRPEQHLGELGFDQSMSLRIPSIFLKSTH